MRHLLLGLIVATGPATGALADTSLSINIELEDALVTTTSYQCGSEGALTIHYITTNDDILALVPVDDDPRVFAGVVSASGSRYVSGQFEWWSHGAEGTLRNVISEETLLDCTAPQ
ncbi:MliC family protein [Gymnodinialimonas sp. 57CJ19]|uniref:MliC family protein n=1 Tax=Gymnodinialimonas sp. 57CJ19 TaxID=3138498 RepID=UPI003134628A